MQLHARRQLAAESIFSRMSRLAASHGAVNLGQGFPAGSPPAFLLEAARSALGTADQYTAPLGSPALRQALADDLAVDADDVVITCGATEALHVLADALYGAGDEVLMFEPVFDVYRPQAALSGAVPVLVPMTLDLSSGSGQWTPDLDALEGLITPRTRALLLNSPHNPTGHVFTRAELERVASLARRHDLWLISDEVYDELYYGDRPLSLRTLAPERTFTVGSAGKRLEATGWRVGWIVTPPGLAPEVAGLHQWATFCAPAPLQAAVAAALPLARQHGLYEQLRQAYGDRMRLLAAGLRELGFAVQEPGGTYFLTALAPGLDPFELVTHGGVAVIPGSAFYAEGAAPSGLIRLAFCKPQDEIERALQRLRTFLKA
ncbi:pyridoxal phosphate-dependent aminotransferase [Deinococcus sp. KNUC1210]|uniref:pyridoxal phosphate-dependent aminotransferase n=1 Tax=Deinococcus sp. KNUC1210 TaxID=2917691 RepID=UPI001EF09E41|nr:pyridoxal phosphate-dependent aminotransferase [Deinococcus sp. KNUC1210]ULH14575.1 pyridoxal phosphate-dependent aminotransferase [Deinococcus sp. KNUC1210]